MSAISIKEFTGMVPRQPDHLLPDSAAALAKNCDFSRTRLAPLKGGLEVLSVGGAIRGMYSTNGSSWYTWPYEVVAHRSPVIGEAHNRIYFIDEGGVLKVTFTPETTSTTSGPPNPASTWSAGMTNPYVAPLLEALDRTTLADYPSATLEFKTWYSDGAANFGVETVVATPAVDWKRYSITPSAKPEDTPEGAVLVVQVTASENNKQLFQMNTATNSTMPARTQALPGGIAMTLEVVADGSYFVNFEWGVVETRAYLFTEVNPWFEESGPSPVSLISPTYMQDVRVTMTHPDMSIGGYRDRIQSNVYRTYGGPQYIKAGTVVGDVVFIDSARTVPETGTSLQSLAWVPPPVGMKGLVLAPNGWFAAFAGNTLYMSEPYRPHVWPYTMTFAKAITGICVGSQVIVVTTFEATYIVTGPHPAAVTSMMVPIPVGGISHRSMCAVEGGVAFLSNDGVMVVEGSQASLEINHRYFTRETWRTMFGSALPSMGLAYHDGCVVAASYNEATGFILELDEAGGAMTRYNYKIDALMRLPTLDTLYYSENGKVYRFREGTELSAEWHSKQFISPKYNKFGIGFARISGSGTIIVTLYADGVEAHKETLKTTEGATKYFRLKSHVGSLKWQVQVTTTGACALEDIAFAQSPDELKNV